MKNLVKVFFNVALVSVLCGSSYTYAALSCDISNQAALAWDDAGRNWPDPVNVGDAANYVPTLSHTETVGGIDFDFAFSSNLTEADFIWSLGSISAQLATIDDIGQIVGPGDLDGDGAPDSGLVVAISPTLDGTNTAVTLDVALTTILTDTITGAESPVSQLEFTISDIDYSAAAQVRQDRVTITGTYQGLTVLPTLTAVSADPTFTILGNVATAIELDNRDASSDFPTSGDLPAENGLLLVTFDQPIDSFTILYQDADETVADGDVGGTRGLSIMNDFSFCSAPDLSITKTDSQPSYTPGESFSYDILVSNTGTGSANGAEIQDILPAWATGATWTCSGATGGAVCPNASGIGDISEIIATFPAASALTYTITGTYSSDMNDYL